MIWHKILSGSLTGIDRSGIPVLIRHYTRKEKSDRKRKEKHLELSSQVANPLKQKLCNSPLKRRLIIDFCTEKRKREKEKCVENGKNGRADWNLTKIRPNSRIAECINIMRKSNKTKETKQNKMQINKKIMQNKYSYLFSLLGNISIFQETYESFRVS